MPLTVFADDGFRASLGRMVMTKGVYDLTHAAHVRSLVTARSRGDTLVVGVASDESVRMHKGPSRPVLSFAERAEILSAFACVDFVVRYDVGAIVDVVRAIRPTRLCASHFTGFDPTARAQLEALGVTFTVVDRPPLRSTSDIIATIVNAKGEGR